MIRKVKKTISLFANVISKMLDDIFCILGITFLDIGAFKISSAVGYIVVGVCFLVFAFFIAKKRGE
ncbi:hypothetical protein [Clostridium felsineum]|uniref:Uncharacterized protein n=1 Tax=Clostridium felsineum TaxID=36839 RepID=A0A1S8KZS6_9CLOT|nr:hypothetical protein [Clostridium felsineum]URZ06481.1 hypothetical protein CLROS_018140 [Clostridium felsineum]URZ11516.1 hypothetical protein CROST_022330 [Clostridium felsineum]